MARPLRVEYPGAFYHVINRGNNKEDIFISDRDREHFLRYLAKSNDRFSIIIHNYKKFVEGLDIREVKNPSNRVINGFILGDIDFVNWVKEAFLADRRDDKEISQLKKLKYMV